MGGKLMFLQCCGRNPAVADDPRLHRCLRIGKEILYLGQCRRRQGKKVGKKGQLSASGPRRAP